MAKGNDVTIRDVYESLSDLRKEISDTYLTKVEFAPIRSIVYGLVGMILTLVIGIIITKSVRAF